MIYGKVQTNVSVSKTFDCRYCTFNVCIDCNPYSFTLNIELSVRPAVTNIHREKLGGIKLYYMEQDGIQYEVIPCIDNR